jgi:3-methyladenine DNA glycosylase Mpg
MERQKDIRAFQTAPKQLLNGPTKSTRELRLQFKEQGARLQEINIAIALTNLNADRNEFFRQVHTHSLVEPKLNNQVDFKLMVTQNREL